ncbi:MAG: twin-arginine translocation signal domain-containing protein, partial [Planctomycetales bacterium]|nr:twin-arginine translocation signal domain-containing protein [Planctomycetales bacterium]
MARSKHSLTSVSRRQFLAATAAGAVCLAAPAIVTADKSGNRTITGQGDYQFEVNHDWAQLPDKYSWQTTHNVAVDRDNNLYVIHEGTADKSDHPSIFVFDAEGRFVRAFGQQFQGGGHGIEVRDEGGEQFL